MTQADEARRLFDEGLDAYRVGEYEEGLGLLAQARDLFVVAGDRTGEAEALGSLGVIHVQLEEWDDAEQLLDKALAVCIDSGDRSNQAKALGNLGMLYARQGDREKAAGAYEKAIAIFHELDDPANEKAVARQLRKLEKGGFLGILGDSGAGPEDEEGAGGPRKLVRRLSSLLGRWGGAPPLEEGAVPELEEDVVDVSPEPDEGWMRR